MITPKVIYLGPFRLCTPVATFAGRRLDSKARTRAPQRPPQRLHLAPGPKPGAAVLNDVIDVNGADLLVG